jgi:hypothetical protein
MRRKSFQLFDIKLAESGRNSVLENNPNEFLLKERLGL